MFRSHLKTDSNLAWHRPQTSISRVEDELMEKSAKALATTTDPLERLRLSCLSRGASGILMLGRIFRELDAEGTKLLSKDVFMKGIKDHLKLDISYEEAEELFERFNPNEDGMINVDELIRLARPPMADMRVEIVEKAFRKLDRSGNGDISIEDIRKLYTPTGHPGYMNGDESIESVLDTFLSNFATKGSTDGKVNLEEFMNYYSGISVSIDNDCYFDLMMRQAYKL